MTTGLYEHNSQQFSVVTEIWTTAASAFWRGVWSKTADTARAEQRPMRETKSGRVESKKLGTGK